MTNITRVFVAAGVLCLALCYSVIIAVAAAVLHGEWAGEHFLALNYRAVLWFSYAVVLSTAYSIFLALWMIYNKKGEKP